MSRICPSFNFSNRGLQMLSKIILLAAAFGSFTPVWANEFELSRIASELSIVSNSLARESKYSRGFGSVGQRADRLARDSAQLVDAIARRRSASYIRSQYADVSGRYSDLEDAFFRASRNYSDDLVFSQVSVISALFSDLSSVYYYSPIYAARASVVTFVNPVIVQRQRFVPNGFRDNHSGVETFRGSRQPAHGGGRERNESGRGEVVQRLRSDQGQHRTGQRIIRSRVEGSANSRRRSHWD